MNSQFSLEYLRQNAFTDHVIINIFNEKEQTLLVYINFMTAVCDAPFINDNLRKLVSYMKQVKKKYIKYEVAFCLIECRQVVLSGVVQCKDPVSYLKDHFPGKVRAYPYNGTEHSMNTVLVGISGNITLVDLGSITADESRRRIVPAFTLGSQKYICVHAYFPRNDEGALDKEHHLYEINKWVKENNGIGFGDGNLSVYRAEQATRTINEGCFNYVLDKMFQYGTFFGSPLDQYAVENIKTFEQMTTLDFVIGKYHDFNIKVKFEWPICTRKSKQLKN